MKIKFFAFALLLFGTSTVMAVEPAANGWYFGGNAGVTRFDDDDLIKNINEAEGEALSLDKTSYAYGIYGGYKFLKFLSLEGRFTSLGDFTVTEQLVGQESIKPTALTANVVGIIPFGASGWEIFGQLGAGGVFINTDFPEVDDDTVLTAGAGVRVYATERVALGLQYDWYTSEQTVLGEKFDFSVGATQFTLHFQF